MGLHPKALGRGEVKGDPPARGDHQTLVHLVEFPIRRKDLEEDFRLLLARTFHLDCDSHDGRT